MPRRVYTYPAGPRARASQPALDDRRVRRRRGGRCCSSSTASCRSIAGAIAPRQSVGRGDASNGRRPRRRRPTISRTSRWSKAARRCGTRDGELPVVTGLRVDEKEMLLTTVVAAAPDLREPVPAAEPVAVHRRDCRRHLVRLLDLLALGGRVRRDPGRDRARSPGSGPRSSSANPEPVIA